MSSSPADVSSLTEEQQAALQQYTSITKQDVEPAVGLLQRSQWNVQIAIQRFFDGEPATDPVAEALANPPQDARRQETLMNGFSSSRPPRANLEPAPRVVSQPESQILRRPSLLLSLLLTPLNLIYALLTRSFRILGYFLPFLPRLLARISGYSQPRSRGGGERKQLQPRDSASRFIREFTEDYGPNRLPFLETSYASALDSAKRDLRFLLVVLLSPEHDDTSSWVRETLLAPGVSSYLSSEQNNNILLWGGSVQDSEPYQVSLALNTTKFPFAALIAHTPSVSTTAMSVVARLVGPMPAAQFLNKLQRAVEQYGPGLEESRRKRREADAVRSLREQQNTAYERSLAQDRERARLKREAEEQRMRAEKEAMRVIEERERRDRNLKAWRKWRASKMEAEPGPDVPDVVRISVRMPDGERVVRRFRGDKELEELYAFVECWDILKGAQDKDIVGEEPDDDFKHEYGFRLVSPMPRESYELDVGGTIAQRIGRSGNFIVEKTHDEDDESSEEE